MNNLIELLHGVSSKLPDIENESQIYQILNDGIKQILPDSYFIITKLQPDDMNFRITHSFGFDKYFTAIKALLGKDPFQMDFPFDNLSEEKRKHFESRKLYHASGGIYDVVNEIINKTICKTIEKILGISEVYGLSFCVGKQYFGGAILFIRKATIESGKLNKECILTIESLAAQASFAINKLRDFEALSKTEEELEKSVSLLTATLESTADGILVVDNNGKFASYNNKFKELWHVPDSAIPEHDNNEEPLMPIALNQLSDPDSFLAKVKELYLSKDTSFDILHFKDGRIYERYSQAQILDGKSVGRVWSFRDVTQTKKAELALKESEKKFRNVFEQATIGLYRTSPEGEILFANPALVNMLGFDSLEHLKERNLKDSGFVDDLTRSEFVKSINKNGLVINFESSWLKKDGAYIQVSENARAIYDDKENIIFYDGVAADITERKTAEKVLKESEERWKALVQDNPNLALQGYDKNGKTIYWNKTSERFYGYTSEEAMGVDLTDLIIPDELKSYVRGAIKEMFATKIPIPASELKLMRKDGSLLDVFSSHSYFQVPGCEPEMYCLDVDISELKRAEAELLNAEEKYRIITEASLDIIFILDKTGKIIFSNNTMANILGYQSNEFLGKSFTQFVPKKEIPKYLKKLTSVFINQEVKNFNTQIYHKNGNVVDVEINGKLIRHEGKLAALGSIRDISQRKLAEETLKKSEEQHRFLFENTPNGVIYLNAKGEIVHANKAAEQILGVSITEMQGLKSCDPRWKANREDGTVYPCEELPALISLKTGQAIKNAKMCVYNPLCNSDKIININSLPKFKNNETKPYQVVTTFEDITAQKKAERELKESEEKYANAQAIAHLGHWELDIINNELTWSDEIYKIFGFESREFKISYDVFLESVHPDDREMVKAAYSNSLQNKTIYETEHRLLLKSGIVKCVQEKCITKFNDKGEPIRSLGTVLDITKRKKAEQLLKESNAAKDKIFSIIAHDLRSPFNSILGFSELLIENTQDFEVAETKKYLGIINSAAKDTLVLLDNLLNWARSQTGKINFKPEKIGLTSIIQEIFELSNSSVKSKNISLKYSSLDEIEVYADENMLMVILRNLISNAIKFTNPNGKIDITALQNDNFIEIAVSDNGVGMKDETRKMLFDISTNIKTRGTANEKGSGLGLILCKEFVTKHDGKIWVESEVGKGSTFYFTLPYQSETIKGSGDKNKLLPPVEEKPINKLKILIAEDDKTSEMLISIAVKKFGKEIINVRTGTEAVAACLNNPDIDLVLMDIQLPEMNGYAATRQIRELNKEVFIIAQTAYAQTGDREKAIEAGCDEYITKPINKKRLLEIINEHFKRI